MRTHRITLESTSHRNSVNHYYSVVDGDDCVYCGDTADCYDHVPPVVRYRIGDKAFKYPACRECNAVLCACPLTSLKDRRRYLFNKFTRKYKKILNMPHWELNEIAELEGFVKNFVMESFRMRPHLIARLLKLKRRMK